MKDETKIWLEYAQENLESAKVLSQSELYNPCLQNVQQSVEKALKALFIENTVKFKKTHNISELKNTLSSIDINVDLSEDECDFLDSIYLPSKYPLGNALPYYAPDLEICKQSISIAKKVYEYVEKSLEK